MDLSTVYAKNISSHVQVLPPWHQEDRERQAIIDAIANNPSLKEKFGLDIQHFTKTDNGYLLETRLYTMEVTVRYLPHEGGFCGPAKFELIFGEVRDRDEVHIPPISIELPLTPLEPSKPAAAEISSARAGQRRLTYRIKRGC